MKLIGLRPGQGPQEDRRADARAGRRDRPHADPWSRASRWPRPRPRSCTRPTPSSGSPRRASGPTARSSRRRSPASGTSRIKHPVGVVGTISPWNFPITLPAAKIAPALAAGCTIVSQPASQTPLSLIQMFECLVDAGLPPGVANLVIGPAQEIADEFLENPAVRKISFTGSTEVGKELMRGAGRPGQAAEPGARRPRPVHRLPRRRPGGQVAKVAVIGKFRNNGQVCIAPCRFYVHEEVAEGVHRGGRRAGQGAQARQRPGAGRPGRPDVREARRWTRPSA